MTPDERFERIGAGTIGGVKLCGRDIANPQLSHAESIDEQRALRGLEARFGPPDRGGDQTYSYSIRDRQTGLEFRAYSAQSGPSYGGAPELFEQTSAGYRLRDDVREVLRVFDEWVESAVTPAGGGRP